jgi:deoxyribonuclease-4
MTNFLKNKSGSVKIFLSHFFHNITSDYSDLYNLSNIYKLRVRQVIPNIDYDSLLKDGIIPADIFIEDLPTKTFPAWGHKNPSIFGFFIENVIKHYIINGNTNNPEDIYNIYKNLINEVPFSFDNEKTKAFFLSLYKFSIKLKTEYNLNKSSFDVELTSDNLGGHPDIVIPEINVMDVKTTRNFSLMRKDTILQFLAYIALYKANNIVVPYISLILPVQKEILSYSILDWASSENCMLFLELLKNETIRYTNLSVEYEFFKSIISYHIPKHNTIYESLKNVERSGLHCFQIFLTNPRNNNSDFQLDKKDIELTPSYLISKKIRLYIHSPYCLNLCTKASYIVDILKRELQNASILGCKGVIVHMGQHKDSKEGKKIMRSNILKAIEYATETCPIILETSAGEGNDICYDMDEFIKFYNKFTFQERKKIKLCIDTCHVFSAGFSPIEFLRNTLRECGPKSLPMIHFNNSQGHKGCKKDRHADIGSGCIGFSELAEIAKICILNKIDMIRE